MVLKYYSKLVIRFLVISWHRIRAFNFEFIMMFIHLLFNFSFVLLFWTSLLRHIHSFGEWSFGELAIFSGITFLGEAIGGIFFGFRDLPQKIIGGGLDKFLVRPMNTLFAVLFEQVSIVYFLEQFLTSILLILIVCWHYTIPISIGNIVLACIVLVVGVMTYHLIYGTITFLAFWFGKVNVFRSLIFGIGESKKYPINIFPMGIQYFLTFVIPIAFISYYPAAVFLGKVRLGLGMILQLSIFIVVSLGLFHVTWRKGLKRYEANGG